MTSPQPVGIVIIGRNEGHRLVRCFKSIPKKLPTIIYVDSGSTDGSVSEAIQFGAVVVALDMSQPFTAARARNTGFNRLLEIHPDIQYVQFIDGDCELDSDWMMHGLTFLYANPTVAVACGRVRELHPEKSLYNRLQDAEWDTPVGEAITCGGIALFRVVAFQKSGGFNPLLIAGEEPELCVRLRQAGWTIWRLDHEMVVHDAAMTRFSQWWKRARRGGFAFAQGHAMHGAAPEKHYVTEIRRAIVWGIILPSTILLTTLFNSPWALLSISIWPLQIIRLMLRGTPWLQALFLTISKFPEALGILTYHWRKTANKETRLIEYK